jgi:hypothetical protein
MAYQAHNDPFPGSQVQHPLVILDPGTRFRHDRAGHASRPSQPLEFVGQNRPIKCRVLPCLQNVTFRLHFDLLPKGYSVTLQPSQESDSLSVIGQKPDPKMSWVFKDQVDQGTWAKRGSRRQGLQRVKIG